MSNTSFRFQYIEREAKKKGEGRMKIIIATILISYIVSVTTCQLYTKKLFHIIEKRDETFIRDIQQVVTEIVEEHIS